MPYETIISCADLMTHLHTPGWVIIDCRFDLARPEWGEEEYRKLHIPSAVYANTDTVLSGPKAPALGRHPLPEPNTFLASMSRLGIDSDTQVVVYDASQGSFSSRLWFLLRFYGHTKVAVLDGSFTEWIKQGLQLESGQETNSPKIFTGSPHQEWIVSTNEVEQNLHKADWLMIDARAAERYSGNLETIDPVAGHIPGAVNRFWGLNLTKDGLFLPPETLRTQFSDLTKGFAPARTVVYCGSGVTSTHHLLALAIAGLPQARLYAGSWSKWIRDPNHPIIQKETSW
jgi:thiosulfate/3-mercaptopyruvate sulfurtransferase